MLCDKIYNSKSLRKFIEKNHTVSMKTYDWLLDCCIVFRDKNHNNTKDFFLSQRYPDEVISSPN